MWNTRYAEKVAGCLHSRGYLHVRIDDRQYKAHRVIWALVTGAWPANEVDHINGKKADNWLSNLREATHSENQHNYGMYANNTSGMKGVSWCKALNKWHSSIKLNGRQHHLGFFAVREEAHAAYCEAAGLLHKEFKNYGTPPSTRSFYAPSRS